MADIKRANVYRCEQCGNIVEVLHAGGGTLTCCGESMKLQAENTTDAAVEKHVPIVVRNGSTVTVKVGSVAHPMLEEHYIEWIEVLAGDKTLRSYLKAGDTPEVAFEIDVDNYLVRAYCNLHGLWRA